MLKIKAENVVRNFHQFDFELEDGTILHESEWNGEKYIVKENGIEVSYLPIYADRMDDNGGYPIVAFYKI